MNRTDRRNRTAGWLRSIAIGARVEGASQCPAPLGPAVELALQGRTEADGRVPVSSPVKENRR